MTTLWPSGKAFSPRAADLDSNLVLPVMLPPPPTPRSSHTVDLEISTLVATLQDDRRDNVTVGTGWPGVNILWLRKTV